METESHAVTHVKNEGAGGWSAVLGKLRFMVFVLSYPPFIFHIGPFTRHYILANKAEIRQK